MDNAAAFLKSIAALVSTPYLNLLRASRKAAPDTQPLHALFER